MATKAGDRVPERFKESVERFNEQSQGRDIFDLIKNDPTVKEQRKNNALSVQKRDLP